MPGPRQPVSLNRLLQTFAGLGLIALFFSLDRMQHGLEITFQRGFTNSSPGELYFWLGSLLLLAPGLILLGLAARAELVAGLHAVLRGVERLTPSQARLAGLLLILALTVTYRLLRLWVLGDFYLTDDEYCVRFGGQVWVAGHLAAPLPVPSAFSPALFLFERDGLVASRDFVAQIAVAAFALWTGLGPWVYALLAGLTGLAAAAAAGVLAGRRAAAVAALLFVCSPMAVCLSITEHAQLVSRGLVALAIWAFVWARAGAPVRLLVAGAAAGTAALARPFETLLLLAPLALATIVAGGNLRTAARRLAWLAAGVLPALLLALAYNAQVTGSPWLLPRFFHPPFKEDVPGLWDRAGSNVAYNTIQLALWFLGPAGVGLALLGAARDRTARLLLIGVGLNLLGGLLHDDWGLHIVGPIHYSESVVPLAIAAALGLLRLPELAQHHRFDPRPVAAALLALIVAGGAVFSGWHLRHLHIMVRPQALGYGLLDQQLKHAVLLAPTFEQFWKTIPGWRHFGSWVFAWRGVSPRSDENVIILNDLPGAAAAARRAFPDRALHRLVIADKPPFVQLPALGPGEE